MSKQVLSNPVGRESEQMSRRDGLGREVLPEKICVQESCRSCKEDLFTRSNDLEGMSWLTNGNERAWWRLYTQLCMDKLQPVKNAAMRELHLLISRMPTITHFPIVYYFLLWSVWVFVFFLAAPYGMRDLSSLTRGGTHASCTGSTVLTTGSPVKSLLWGVHSYFGPFHSALWSLSEQHCAGYWGKCSSCPTAVKVLKEVLVKETCSLRVLVSSIRKIYLKLHLLSSSLFFHYTTPLF